MRKALYIDPVDVTCQVAGGGMSTVFKSAVRCCPEKFVFVGYSSSRELPLGKLSTLTVFGRAISVFAIGLIDTRMRFVPDVVKFLFLLRRYVKQVDQLGIHSVFTRHYASLWFFASRPTYKVCYYAPGLGNPMLLGRRPRVGRLLASSYSRIHAHFVGKTECAFAAASRDVVHTHNQYLARHGIPQRFQFLPTGVDTSLMYPCNKLESRRVLGLSTDLNVFAYVGRLTKIKGVDFLLESFRCTVRRRSNSLLVIAGEGEEEQSLKKRATDLDVDKKVRFLGRVPHHEVPFVIGAADVCVIGSLAEGFSLAMIEQVACGRPVVTSDVSGARDLIKNGVNGFIVVERDQEVFADHMINALELKRAESYSRRLIESNFTEEILWNKIADKWPTLK